MIGQFWLLVHGWNFWCRTITIHTTICDLCTRWGICSDLHIHLPTQQTSVDVCRIVHSNSGSLHPAWVQSRPRNCNAWLWASCDECHPVALRATCTHPQMFLPSHTVYMEENTESWVSYFQVMLALLWDVGQPCFLARRGRSWGNDLSPGKHSRWIWAITAVFWPHIFFWILSSDTATTTSRWDYFPNSHPSQATHVRTIYIECAHHHTWRWFQNKQCMWGMEQ